MVVTYFLYDGFTALDVIGTNEILSRLPDTHVKMAAMWKGEVKSDSQGVKLVSTHTINEIDKTDILIIPGSTVTFLEVLQNKDVLNWISGLYQHALYVCSVSSGSIILAAAGLLKGRKATSHWYSMRFLAEYGVATVSERYVVDGRVMTSAGSSAGIDMALYLASIVDDVAQARAIELMIEYAPVPPMESGNLALATKDTMLLAKKKLKEDALRSGILTLI
jgi:transcriptional regulator GlxA family with amidase domain